MRFSDIPGLSAVKSQLIHTVKSGHVAHAQLFHGQPGSAQLALALAYATYINCEQPTEEDSCGTCRSCTKMDKWIHPDLHFVFPVSATKNITGKNVVSASYLREWRAFLSKNKYGSLEDWNAFYGAENKQSQISKEESRNMIKALTLKAFEAEYKTLLIWLPENMHNAAANGILKILEEPPPKTLFLLISADHQKLLTTILSRCQWRKVPRFSEEDIQTYLVKEKQLSVEKAKTIAVLAEGNIKAAVEHMDSIEDEAHVLFREWMRQCWTRNYTALHATNESFHKMGKTAQKLFLQYAIHCIRHALIYDLIPKEQLKLNAEEQGFAKKFGQALATKKLEMLSKELNYAYYHLERNANIRILFMDLSLTIGRVMTA